MDKIEELNKVSEENIEILKKHAQTINEQVRRYESELSYFKTPELKSIKVSNIVLEQTPT